MKIFIKKYLRQIPIIDQFCNMINQYIVDYPDDDSDLYEMFREQLKGDTVKNFLNFVTSGSDEQIINYLSALFYSVKGTCKVLDYLTEYELLEDTTISYTTQNLSITMNSLPENLDRELFCNYLEKFLNTLLYFESLTINIGEISVKVDEKTTTSLNHGEAFYQYYEV